MENYKDFRYDLNFFEFVINGKYLTRFAFRCVYS